MFRGGARKSLSGRPALRLKAAPRALQLCDIALQDGKYAGHWEHSLLCAFRREA